MPDKSQTVKKKSPHFPVKGNRGFCKIGNKEKDDSVIKRVEKEPVLRRRLSKILNPIQNSYIRSLLKVDRSTGTSSLILERRLN